MNNQIKPVAHIVLKFARRLTDSAIEADDIAQCAMLKVLKSVTWRIIWQKLANNLAIFHYAPKSSP